MKRAEKTWILRGVVRRFIGTGEISLVLEINSVQSGNAKAYRYETAKPWIELGKLENSQEKLSGFAFYPEEELIVWIKETTRAEKREFSLKKIEEKTMTVILADHFLQNFL